MSVEQSNLVFFDVETGGPNPNRHPIIQIAAAAVDGATLTTIATIELKVQFDEYKAMKYSLRKNSYSRRIWQQEALPEQQAARTLANFFHRHATCPQLAQNGNEYRLAQLVAHNAPFDVAFLHAWYERLKIFCPARHQALCTLQRSFWHFFENPAPPPPKNFKLETLCQHFGIPFYAAEAHDALGDVQATVALYKALVARLTTIPYSTAA